MVSTDAARVTNDVDKIDSPWATTQDGYVSTANRSTIRRSMLSNTRHLAVALGVAAVSWCLRLAPTGSMLIAQSRAVVDGYRVVNVYPHDPDAYTQGLIYRDGFLFESTGLNGRSTVRKVRLETGEVVQQHRVNQAHFAEGLTEWNGQLVQLTWRSNIAFVYDLASLAPQQTLNFAGEGWGLTHDRQAFILSDGTENLRFFARRPFREIRRVVVRDGNVPVKELNELEYVRGEVYANVWHTDRIARISPQSGRVTGWIDLRGLMSTGYQLDSEAVLNGIAYDAVKGRLFVTGKLWPKLFEIEVVPRE
jgi:glutamine cyclotransferase